MSIRRIVPNIASGDPGNSREFYTKLLGMEVAMSRDEIVTYVSPENPTAQLSVLRRNGPDAPHPDVSIEVDDVDAMHARAVAQGVSIVHPLTDGAWGVRRFFAVDPDGTIVNILSHC